MRVIEPGAERSRRQIISWLAVLLIAIALRTVALDRWPGANGDESWHGVAMQELQNGSTPHWATRSGNLVEPIHSAILFVLLLVFTPSVVVLRIPEVLLGVAAVAAAYPAFAKVLGQRGAMFVTMCVAVCPIMVANARMGWDPGATPLLTLLAFAAALADRPVACLIALAFAYIAHPTNIFMVPILAAVWAPEAWRRYQAASAAVRSRLLTLGAATLLVGVPIAAWLALQIARNPDTRMPSISMVITRLTSPQLAAERAWGFVNMVSGVSTAEHFADRMAAPAAAAANWLIVALFVIGIGVGWRTFKANRFGIPLLAGMAVSFAVFHIVALPLALQPSLERYGMFMLLPLFVTAAIAFDAASRRFRLFATIATTLTIVTFGAVTVGAYMYPMAAYGGNAWLTYRTGPIEPKAAAFAFIKADSKGEATKVLAEDWFIYWTLRYFAGANGPIYVDARPGSLIPGGARPEGVPDPVAPSPHRNYLVAYAGSKYPPELGLTAPVFTAFDPIGRPVIHVYLAGRDLP